MMACDLFFSAMSCPAVLFSYSCRREESALNSCASSPISSCVASSIFWLNWPALKLRTARISDSIGLAICRDERTDARKPMAAISTEMLIIQNRERCAPSSAFCLLLSIAASLRSRNLFKVVDQLCKYRFHLLAIIGACFFPHRMRRLPAKPSHALVVGDSALRCPRVRLPRLAR